MNVRAHPGGCPRWREGGARPPLTPTYTSRLSIASAYKMDATGHPPGWARTTNPSPCPLAGARQSSFYRPDPQWAPAAIRTPTPMLGLASSWSQVDRSLGASGHFVACFASHLVGLLACPGGGPDLVCGRPFLTLCPRRCGIGRRQAALVLHCQQATHCTQRRKRARVPAHGTSCEHRVVVRTICRQTGQVSNRPRAYDERSNATTQSHRWRRHRVPSCATLSRDCNASAVNGWCTQARPPTRVKANGLPQSKSRQPDGANWGPHRREGQSTGRAAPSHHYPPCFRANSAEVGMMWTELGR